MKKRFLPLCMLLITMVLAQASIVANAAENPGKYVPRDSSKATFSSFMKSIRANQETGLIDPAQMIAGQKAAQNASRSTDYNWSYAGPDNFGGLTRGIVYFNDNDIMIGVMGGDIYRSTDGCITFEKVTSLNLTISCMVANSDGDIFIGTGDGRDAQVTNGLSNLDYSTSFRGNGIYKLAKGSTKPELLEGTEDWYFINEMTIFEDKIYAATSHGIRYSSDNGQTWENIFDGNYRSIKSNSNGDLLVTDSVNVYLKKNGADFQMIPNLTTVTAATKNPKIIAMAPSNPNYMYIAYLNGSSGKYKTGDIFFTKDGGDSWEYALAVTSNNYFPIMSSDAAQEAFMIVYPDNYQKILIGSDNLWLLEDKTGNGTNSYTPKQVSVAGTPSSSLYLHQGIQNIVFYPSRPKLFLVGTNGGIFRGRYDSSSDYYLFTNCNRYFIDEDHHCSPTRMMNVGIGGTDKVIGACLDYGSIRIDRDPKVNNITTGISIFPNTDPTSPAVATFNKSYAGGPSVISTINPNIIFVSGTGSMTTPLHRTETNGVDYDATMLYGGDSPVITNSAFKTPYALYENYNETRSSLDIYTKHSETDTTGYEVLTDTAYIDTLLTVIDTAWIVYGVDTVEMTIDTLEYVYQDTIVLYDTTWITVTYDVIDTTTYVFDTLYYAVKDTLEVGDSVIYYSRHGGYPIDMVMPDVPESLHDSLHEHGATYVWIPGDTVRGLHDHFSSTLVCGIDGKVYMTKLGLIFDEKAKWFLLSDIDGTPSAVAISADGTTAYVGTSDGKLYKFPKLKNIYRKEQVDSSDDLNYIYKNVESFLVHEFKDPISTATGGFKTRAITSIAIDPNHKKNIVVTLGNYDSEVYVYRSEDSGENFESIQGKLALAPVYSSIIDKKTNNIMIGTENGIFVTEYDSIDWQKTGTFSCPIMDLKQGIVPNRHDRVVVLKDEMGDEVRVTYPGVKNNGVIYAATYGSGIIISDPHAATATSDDDDNNEIITENIEHIKVYPNPVKSNAQIDITLDSESAVSYVIYDLSGRMISNSDLGTYVKGMHTLNINTENLSNGTYIIKLTTGDTTKSTKFLVY